MDNTKGKKLIKLRSISSDVGGPIQISLPHLYQLAKRGVLPTVRLGRSILISSAYVDTLIAIGHDNFPPKQ